jgi:hypothetical protein
MAVTANQRIEVQSPGELVSYLCAASKRFYKGTLAFILPAGHATDVIATTANVFGGIVKEEVDNSSGAAGDLRVECWTHGDFVLGGSGFAQANVGDLMYGVDNFTVNNTATDQPLVGRCVEFISSTKIVVRIEVVHS